MSTKQKLPGVALAPFNPPAVQVGEPFFHGDEEKDTDPAAPAFQIECRLDGCVECRAEVKRLRADLMLWRALTLALCCVLVLGGVVLQASGCSAAQQAAMRAEGARCAGAEAPELLDQARAAFSEQEWRGAVGGLGLRLGFGVVRCLAQALAAGASTRPGVSPASHALRSGCPSGSCDDGELNGPEAYEPAEVLKGRAVEWLREQAP